jgi:hypothetical protein
VTLRDLFHRWCKLAANSRGRKKYEAILYFDGPITRWNRSSQNWKFEQHPGGLRIPLDGMPAPDERDVIQRRAFRFEFFARVFVIARLKGFDTAKLVGEVRTL